MFFIRLFLANTWEKKSGVTVLLYSQTAVKGGHSFEIAVRMDNLRGGTGARYKINVFTFGGAKRSGSDRECKYFPIGMNAREPLWR